jgi:hypothetical protein
MMLGAPTRLPFAWTSAKSLALLLAVAISGVAASHEDEVCSGDETTCQSGGEKLASVSPFEVSQEHKALVAELHRQLDTLNKIEGVDEQARQKKCASSRALVVSIGGYCKQKGFGGNMWGLGEALKFEPSPSTPDTEDKTLAPSPRPRRTLDSNPRTPNHNPLPTKESEPRRRYAYTTQFTVVLNPQPSTPDLEPQTL